MFYLPFLPNLLSVSFLLSDTADVLNPQIGVACWYHRGLGTPQNPPLESKHILLSVIPDDKNLVSIVQREFNMATLNMALFESTEEYSMFVDSIERAPLFQELEGGGYSGLVSAGQKVEFSIPLRVTVTRENGPVVYANNAKVKITIDGISYGNKFVLSISEHLVGKPVGIQLAEYACVHCVGGYGKIAYKFRELIKREQKCKRKVTVLTEKLNASANGLASASVVGENQDTRVILEALLDTLYLEPRGNFSGCCFGTRNASRTGFIF